MMKFMNKNNISTDSQFGFRTNNSTELAVTSIYDKLLQNLEDKKVTCSIFLDLKKAFDSVDHCIYHSQKTMPLRIPWQYFTLF